jgi:SAM-dependent methyltransferase
MKPVKPFVSEPSMNDNAPAMNDNNDKTVYQEKYTQANFITRRLIDGFFNATGELIAALPDVRTAVEFGCGEGVSTRRISKLLPPGAVLEASDFDERRVQAAQALNPGIRCATESLYELHRPDDAFDLVIVLEVLEHLDDPDRALREICRVARKWVILSVPREPLWRLMNLARLKYAKSLGNTPGHVQHWSWRSFRRFAGRYGVVRKWRTPLPWTIVLLDVEGG